MSQSEEEDKEEDFNLGGERLAEHRITSRKFRMI